MTNDFEQYSFWMNRTRFARSTQMKPTIRFTVPLLCKASHHKHILPLVAVITMARHQPLSSRRQRDLPCFRCSTRNLQLSHIHLVSRRLLTTVCNPTPPNHMSLVRLCISKHQVSQFYGRSNMSKRPCCYSTISRTSRFL